MVISLSLTGALPGSDHEGELARCQGLTQAGKHSQRQIRL